MLKGGSKRFGLAGQDSQITANGYKSEAESEIVICLTVIGGENSHRLIEFLAALHCIRNHGLHLRMTGISKMSQIRRKIRGTYEQAIHTDNRSNLVKVSQRLSGLELHKYAKRLRCTLMVLFNPAKPAGPVSCCHASNASRWIARCRDNRSGSGRMVDHRNQQGTSTRIEIAFYGNRIRNRDSYNRLHRFGGQCSKLLHHIG